MGLLDRVESWLPKPLAETLDHLARPQGESVPVIAPPAPSEAAPGSEFAPPPTPIVVSPPPAAPHTFLASIKMPAFVGAAIRKAEDAIPYVVKGALDAAGVVTYPASYLSHVVNRAIGPELNHLQQKMPQTAMILTAVVQDVGLSENALNRPLLDAVAEPTPSSGAAEPGVSPTTTGNAIENFVDGEASTRELLAQIAGAKSSIWLESYEWQDNGTGHAVANALIAAKKKAADEHRAFDIKVVVDNRTNWVQVQHLHQQAEPNSPVVVKLRAAGIDIRQVDYSADRVNHRKVSVFDGTTAFVGGQNIGDNYLLPLSAGWTYHDGTQRFVGPAAYDVASIFEDSWFRTGGAHLTLSGRPPPNAAATTASSKVQIVRHSGGLDRNIERELIQRIDAEGTPTLSALDGRSTAPGVVLENGFGMSDAVFRAVLRARERGVPVTWLWGNASNDATIMAAHHYDDLKKAGVEMRSVPSPLHMKAYYFAQSQTLLQGSSNLDGFSTMVNDEADAQVQGPAAKQFYDTVMAPDMARSSLLTAAPAPATAPTRLHSVWVKIFERVADGD